MTDHEAQSVPIGDRSHPRSYMAFCPGCSWWGTEYPTDLYGRVGARTNAMIDARRHVDKMGPPEGRYCPHSLVRSDGIAYECANPTGHERAHHSPSGNLSWPDGYVARWNILTNPGDRTGAAHMIFVEDQVTP